MRTAQIGPDLRLPVYRPGDKLQQHVSATDYWLCTGQAISCSDTLRQHIARWVAEERQTPMALSRLKSKEWPSQPARIRHKRREPSF